MIDRYTLPEMGALWTEHSKFQKWLEVEIAVCEVHAEMGTIPADALEQIKSRAAFTVDRINEIEKTTNHDVIAFTTNLAENVGEAARFIVHPPALFEAEQVEEADGGVGIGDQILVAELVPLIPVQPAGTLPADAPTAALLARITPG